MIYKNNRQKSFFMEEKNKENTVFLCQFYEKTGCCGRGDMCAKVHRQEVLPRIVCFHHLYPDPDVFEKSLGNGKILISVEEKQRLLDSFFVDVYLMLQRFGPIDDIVVAGNKNDLLNGNVYAMFKESDAAFAVVQKLDGQYYAGRKISVTLTPILRLSNCLCTSDSCPGSDTCNFVHQLVITETIYRMCFPRFMRAYPEQFRETKKRKGIDSPTDVLYGRSKYSAPV